MFTYHMVSKNIKMFDYSTCHIFNSIENCRRFILLIRFVENYLIYW